MVQMFLHARILIILRTIIREKESVIERNLRGSSKLILLECSLHFQPSILLLLLFLALQSLAFNNLIFDPNCNHSCFYYFNLSFSPLELVFCSDSLLD